jgi:3-oxoacyl-[acyl-carrier protein] reductase
MYGSVLDYSDDEINRMMRTNFEGTVHITRACLPTMLDKKVGDIIMVASVAGFRGGGDESIYAGTKFAIGAGRTTGSPALAEYLRPDDVAFQVLTIMRQPLSVRSHIWTLWSMQQQS